MKIKISLVAILICSLVLTIVPSSFAAEQGNEMPFVRIENGKFIAGDEEYRALGVCISPAHSANYDYITRVIREAKSNGITLIRAVDLWEGVYGQGDDALYSDSVWKRVDWMIKSCKENEMRLLLDLSSVRQFLFYSPNRRDSYSPSVLPIWDEILSFVTNRTNVFTGVKYKDDPVIMSYALAGEPVCYGGQLDDWSNGYFTSRRPEDIQASVFHTADTLRSLDSNHLISTGGLLHLSPKDSQGIPFYEGIWKYPNIDYAAVHIYPESNSIGEWANLPAYKQFCDTIEKPLMIEEFGEGGIDMAIKQEYLDACFSRCYENDIPVAILWNWSLGQSFDVFSHMAEITNLLHENARRWGYQENFKDICNPVVTGSVLESFEENNSVFVPNTSDPGYGGKISVTNILSSNGKNSLKIPVNFSEKFQWYWLNANFSEPLQLNENYLAADIFLPEDAPPLSMKFSLNGIEQNESGRINNYLIPGQWNTVYVNLTQKDTSPEGCDWMNNIVPNSDIITALGILFINGNSIYQGDIYVDNLRTGNLILFDEINKPELELSTEIRTDGNLLNVAVTPSGGTGKYSFTYYIVDNGKLFYSNKQTSLSQISCNLPSHNYRLYVYVEDSLNHCAKNIVPFSIN